MDPTYPVERLSFMLRDAKAAVLVTGVHYRTLSPDHWQVLTIDNDWGQISLQSTTPLRSSRCSAGSRIFIWHRAHWFGGRTLACEGLPN